MKFSYKKRDNNKIFTALEKKELVNMTKLQNYIPLYNRFFTLNDSNCNSINLDHTFSIYSISGKESENKFEGKVLDEKNNKSKKDIFFKYSPLLDPIKYIIGKYDMSNVDVLTLPEFGKNNSHAKVRDPNNSAYIDSFFTYLTSKILHEDNFLHGLDFYGSFLGVKHDFTINVIDDIDYINESSFFHKNNGVLFTIDTSIEMGNDDTRNYKKRLNLNNNDEIILQLSDIKDLTHLESIFATSSPSQSHDAPEVIFENIPKSKKNSCCSSVSTCSSRSSNTDASEADASEADASEDEMDAGASEADANASANEMGAGTDANASANEMGAGAGANEIDESEEDDDYEEEELMAKITNFPVQIIALEKCEGTLDSLIMENDITDNEWGSIVIQILMTLITFQKKFHLTHNDLHTNNIMYIKTKLEYLYYILDGKYYKVPTYGRIYKIIDFGRAIYKFRGNLMCSDSFHPKGDAATQYNFEPYFNGNKPRLEPNYSFDLCRLGCALFDFITKDTDEEIDQIKSPILKIIAEWCKDDKGRNIMYKTNGEERYPDFKLYKMIARTVHNHIPINVIDKPYFDKYIINKNKVKLGKNQTIMNIDIIPNYTELISNRTELIEQPVTLLTTRPYFIKN